MAADPPLPVALPWYFIAVLAGLWLATVTGIVVLARRRIRIRREQRGRRRRRARTALPANLRQ